MSRRNIFWGSLLVIFVTLVSCNDRVTTFDPDTHERTITSSEGEFDLADETIILPESTLQLLSDVSEDGNTYEFSEADELLNSLEPGRILIFGISDLTPYGALKRVSFIEQSGRGILISTNDVALDEAFENLFIEAKHTLTPDQVQKLTVEIPSQKIIEEYSQKEFRKMTNTTFRLSVNHKFYPFDDPIDRDTTLFVKASGTIEIEPELDFLVDVRRLRLREFRMVIDNKIKEEIKVEVNFSEGIKKEIVIYRYYFVPLTFGPIIFTPKLTLIAGVEGSATVGIEALVGVEVTTRGGIQYGNGDWQRVSDFSPNFYASMSDVFANFLLKVYLGPKIDFLLYGSAGPYVNVLGFGEVSVDSRRQSELQAYAGIEANAGAEMKFFSKTVAKFEVNDLFSIRRLVYEKSFANPPTLTTNTITNITPSTATTGGVLTDTGGGNITKKGVCWSTSRNPDLTDTCTNDGSGSGSYTSFLSDLSDDTRYYVRAYAENSSGVGYGQERSFITQEADDRTFDMNICNVWQVAQSGGVGVTVDNWNISQIPQGATFDIRFNAYGIPDKFVVEYPAGTVQHDTGWRGDSSYNNDTKYPGGISGGGIGEKRDLFTKRSQNAFRVVVTGVDNSTAWDYQVRCRL